MATINETGLIENLNHLTTLESQPVLSFKTGVIETGLTGGSTDQGGTPTTQSQERWF